MHEGAGRAIAPRSPSVFGACIHTGQWSRLRVHLATSIHARPPERANPGLLCHQKQNVSRRYVCTCMYPYTRIKERERERATTCFEFLIFDVDRRTTRRRHPFSPLWRLVFRRLTPFDHHPIFPPTMVTCDSEQQPCHVAVYWPLTATRNSRAHDL